MFETNHDSNYVIIRHHANRFIDFMNTTDYDEAKDSFVMLVVSCELFPLQLFLDALTIEATFEMDVDDEENFLVVRVEEKAKKNIIGVFSHMLYSVVETGENYKVFSKQLTDNFNIIVRVILKDGKW